MVLLAAVSLAFAAMLWPFQGPLLWSLVIGLMFAPLFRRVMTATGQRRSLAALLTLGVVLLVVILPLVLLSAALAGEAGLAYDKLQSGEWKPAAYLHGLYNNLPPDAVALLGRIGLGKFSLLQAKLVDGVSQGAQFMATQALSLGQNAFKFIASLFITLYLAFFMIRDGDSLARTLRHALPLAPEHKRELFAKFATVLRATVKGHLLVAAVQGSLGALAFWALDIGAPLLWGVLMAFLSLLPLVGSALVWLPAALYLLGTGSVWQGLALLGYGVLVIGLVDNLLRPLLIGKDTRMPDYLVMISTLGGIAVFGINGLILGPALAAMFLAVWHIDMASRPS
ncbi:MAG: AI-2E family transporter [Burkholderiales bacterium]|nr:AI-2E family transporter [Burkholderiales bacterium]MBP6405237.1 AI-2E family transporter [Ramlibacter sp.]